jgi:hypothetical protein
MKQKFDDVSRATMLENIKQEFATFRSEIGGRSPERLKALAVSAVKEGERGSQVAAAAGVTPWTLSQWVKKARTEPKAKQLKLVASRPSSFQKPASDWSGSVVCVRLVSGIEIEFPRSEISIEFLSMMNNIGGGN